MKLVDYGRKYFSFLHQYGYSLEESNHECVISFPGYSNTLRVWYDMIGCEITCSITDQENHTIRLQDALDYENLVDYRGIFQIARSEDLETAVSYLGTVLKILFERNNIADASNFGRIYEFKIRLHKQELQDYYVRVGKKKADDYWKQKEYSKAAEIYEQYIHDLSEVQMKRLKICKRELGSN